MVAVRVSSVFAPPTLHAVSALAAFALLSTCACATSRVSERQRRSPQWSGARFINPWPAREAGPWATARHILFNRNGAWPAKTLYRSALPRLPRTLPSRAAAITFINHATVLIQLRGLNVLTDPVWSQTVGPFPGIGPTRAREPGIPFHQLPPIDVVLISHNHYDHLDRPTLERLAARDQPRVFGPLGDEELLRSAGFRAVQTLDWWQEVEFAPGVRAVFTPARHNSGRGLGDRDRSLWGGFLIDAPAARVFFAGDTAYAPHFREIRDRFGRPDLAILPIGAYLPRDTTQAFHMSPDEAVQAQQDLGAPLALAIHFGCFQLSGEDFDQPVRDLHAAKRREPGPGPFMAVPEGRTVHLVRSRVGTRRVAAGALPK